jgi:glycosidase
MAKSLWALACLYSLPGVPCLYYGTEQGLHGHGSDPAVREALWGPGFNEGSKFYSEIQEIANVRSQQATLRYGRFYFRPASGDGRNFGISGFPQGILTFSRILNDQEVLIVANTNTTQQQELDVIVDIQLSSEGDPFAVLYSNQLRPAAPGRVRSVAQGSASVHEVDGSLGQGPLHVVHVKLNPLEAQILRRRTV